MDNVVFLIGGFYEIAGFMDLFHDRIVISGDISTFVGKYFARWYTYFEGLIFESFLTRFEGKNFVLYFNWFNNFS